MTTSSLLAAGLELVGLVTNPEYRLQAGGIDLGSGEPDDAVIASLLLDGDEVTGDRTKNRQPTLTVKVVGATRSDLTAKVDTLLLAVTAATWSLQWTPTSGLPIVFDCYRASWTRTRDAYQDGVLQTLLTVTFQALPFGRSPDALTISGSSSLQIDSFNTAPTGATLDTAVHFEGTGSAKFNLTSVGTGQYATSTPVSRTFTAANVSTYGALSVRLLSNLLHTSSMVVTVTLSSSGGRSSTYQVSALAAAGWQLLSFNLATPVGTAGGGADLTAVTGHSITMTVAGRPMTVGPVTVHLDDLRALGGTSTLISTTAGEVLLMPAVIGSARTPVFLSAAGTIDAVLLHSPPADQDVNAAILIPMGVLAAPNDQIGVVNPPNAGFAGTYSLILGAGATPSGANTVTVTISQYAGTGGTIVATKAFTFSYTGVGLTGTLIPVGDVTLPLRATAADNTTTYYTFEVNHTAGSDTYPDLMLCDVRGQTVIAVPPTSAAVVYVDAPDVGQGVGPIMATAVDRTEAYGIFDGVLAVGGPILFEPGTNKVLAWVKAGAPTVAATYYPRWLDERVS